MLATVAQLPGHIPAERDVPVHGPAEGGAQVQARDGVAEPEADRAPAVVVVVQVQVAATAGDGQRQRNGLGYPRERHVQRERGPAGVLRRPVRGPSGAVEVLWRPGATARGGQRAHHAGGVQVVGAQLAGHVLRADARVPAAQLRARPADSVRRLGLARLRQGAGRVRVRHQRVRRVVQAETRRVGEPATLRAAQQHVHVQVPGTAGRPCVDVLRELRAPQHQQVPLVQTVPDPVAHMGRRRGHAVRRPLRHAQAVRARGLGDAVVVRGQRDGDVGGTPEAAVHVGRELPVQVGQRHTAGALRARHGARAVQLPAALRVCGQRRVRPGEQQRSVRDRLQGDRAD